jgi:hypothetical protein
VLSYAPPSPDSRRWYRHPAWPRAALCAALVYAGLTLFFTFCVPLYRPSDFDGAEGILMLLCLFSPLGLVALILGIIGHYPRNGRRHAGPALWIVGLTPGVSSLLWFLTYTLTRGATPNLLKSVLLVAGIDAIVLFALRGRILRARSDDWTY